MLKNNLFHKILFLAIFFIVVVSCQKVPLTGRTQLSLVSGSEMIGLSSTEYDKFLKENKISTDAAGTALVKKVGGRIKEAVETYMAQNNLTSRLDGFKWEFNLVESKELNAWCMAGGKVVVYTGILPTTKDETGLAVVLGHEIAHAIAGHSAERASQQLIQQYGGAALTTLLSGQSATAQQLSSTIYGYGSQVGLLKYSRTHESEADHLGLIFMSMAGYDPNKSIEFWQRMAESSKGSTKPPEFLSTHPADETRIADLKKELPEALKYYKPKN